MSIGVLVAVAAMSVSQSTDFPRPMPNARSGAGVGGRPASVWGETPPAAGPVRDWLTDLREWGAGLLDDWKRMLLDFLDRVHNTAADLKRDVRQARESVAQEVADLWWNVRYVGGGFLLLTWVGWFVGTVRRK